MGTRRWWAAATALLVAGALPVLAPVPAEANVLAQGNVVNPNPVDYTPNVLDGYVTSITTVGSRVFVAGTFTRVGETGTWVTYNRSYLFAFDRDTGAIDQGFVPVVDGVVEVVESAGDGQSVFIGGRFANVNGVANYGIAKLDAATGQMVPGFNAFTSGNVRDLAVSGNKVYLGGDLWKVNNINRKRLAAIDATTGALDPNFTVGPTQPRVSVDWVQEVAVNRQGTELAIIGNFLAVEGLPRAQIARIDLTGPQATVMPWSTQRFGNVCSSSFWTYLNDVEYSLAGDYFVIPTTGGPSGTNLCDTATRWETSSQSATSVETWADYSGGDTLTAVAITDNTIYVGGHQRWMNNHAGSNTAGAGAVSREGIVALDPANGVPYRWNPGKHRGIAVWDIHLSDHGMYIGSDTDFTAGEYHAKLAEFPLAGGSTVPVVVPDRLPTTLYTGDSGTTTTRRSFTGTTFGADSPVSGNPISWTSVGDAFYEAGKLYYINSSTLTSRTFDGTTFGPAVTEPSWTTWPSVTAAAYYQGRLYYVQSNSTSLRYRYFSVESGIVGSQTFTVPGISWSNIAGMDFAGNKLYYARTDGNLYSVDMAGVAPVSGTQTLLSGPLTGDGKNWNRAALFFLTSDNPPTITLSSPAAGSVVSGVVDITATVDDAEGVAQVAFSVGGTTIGVDTNGADGWGVSWNSAPRADGPVTISATVTDTGGQSASASVTVTVDNLGPTVTITEPAAGAVVSGNVTISATATDAVGVARVDFLVAGVAVGSDTDGANGWSTVWNSTVAADGPTTVTATATDTAGRSTSATITATVDNVVDPPARTVALVVANAAALNAGEVAVRDRLTGLGFTVQVVDDNAATAATATGQAFVVVSSTVASNVIGTTFRDVATPVWMAKPYLLDDMGMTGTAAEVDYGTVAAGTTIGITTPTHPVAAGLSGTVPFTTASTAQSYGVPTPAATVITTTAGRATTFVYRPGALLASGTPAPACRFTFPLFQNGPAAFTTQAWSMFDAAANHLAENCPGDPPPPAERVAFVVANPAALIAGETAVRTRLAGLGYDVTVVDDNGVTAAVANGTVLVLVSSTVSSNVVAATFRDVATPVWMAKPFLLDDMGMTGTAANVDYGTVAAGTTTDIAAAAHPIAAGLTGTVSLTSAAFEQSFGVPAAAATVITTTAGRATTFVYRPGTTLASGAAAPACRITFPLFQNAPSSFTTQAWSMFDAAVGHAADNCPA